MLFSSVGFRCVTDLCILIVYVKLNQYLNSSFRLTFSIVSQVAGGTNETMMIGYLLTICSRHFCGHSNFV